MIRPAQKPSHKAVDYETYFRAPLSFIERSLNQFLPKRREKPTIIHEAMRYSVMGRGKRVRPVLTLEVCAMLGGQYRDAILPACAIELIHAYSLIHDDLPALDNDDMRRGKPSCHKKYGEAIAILAGDALLTKAFELLSKYDNPQIGAQLSQEIARSVGTLGMIGGQVLDIEHASKRITLKQLSYMNRLKTGKLIQMSCLAGALSAGAGPGERQKILTFGSELGFAFQLVDDIMDSDGYLRLMNQDQARREVQAIIRKAKKSLQGIKGDKNRLFQMADFFLTRTS